MAGADRLGQPVAAMSVRRLPAKGLFWANGRWHTENPPVVGPGSHAF